MDQAHRSRWSDCPVNATVLSRVQRIMADVFSVPVERVTLESSSETIESWDSLQHLNLMLALEQEFGLELLPDEIERLVSVHDIATLVSDKLQATKAL
jgi:acyl carrier protein